MYPQWLRWKTPNVHPVSLSILVIAILSIIPSSMITLVNLHLNDHSPTGTELCFVVILTLEIICINYLTVDNQPVETVIATGCPSNCYAKHQIDINWYKYFVNLWGFAQKPLIKGIRLNRFHLLLANAPYCNQDIAVHLIVPNKYTGYKHDRGRSTIFNPVTWQTINGLCQNNRVTSGKDRLSFHCQFLF